MDSKTNEIVPIKIGNILVEDGRTIGRGLMITSNYRFYAIVLIYHQATPLKDDYYNIEVRMKKTTFTPKDLWKLNIESTKCAKDCSELLNYLNNVDKSLEEYESEDE